MNFSFLQKFISFFLIFFLLFSFTIRIPFVAFFETQTYAAEEKFYDLVSIIVDEEVYDDVRSKLVRYTQDIQGVLENTRVVILPTPSTATSLDIASLNEKLFFEWYKWVKDVNFESKLVWTVLVWDIPIPITFDGNNSSRTLLPYIDFEEKSYIYDHENERYEINIDSSDVLQPEIWHGVISPNSGDRDTDIDLIQWYFDKNHDFYEGEWNFDITTGIINNDNSDTLLDSYEPYVFYYDQFRETQALSYEKYEWYRAYLQNQEDIVYNRYTRELADTVKNQVLGTQNENIVDLIEKAIPWFPTDGFSSGPDIEQTPDIQTRFITDNATNKFLEIFNEWTLADIRKYVHNAGRYNGQWSEVNVDLAPFLISVLDDVSTQVIKNINTNLEWQIDDIVKNGLARDIAVPTSRNSISSTASSWAGVCGTTYTNFYYGFNAADISSAKDCSIYRGANLWWWKLVEANRGGNISLIQGDLGICGWEIRTNSNGVVTWGIQWYWWGNTPINLNKESLTNATFELDTHNLKWGIRPVFDIVGAKQVQGNALTPSPLDCFDTNLLQTQRRVWQTQGGGRDNSTSVCVTDSQAPVWGLTRAGSWNCSTLNNKLPSNDTFESLYSSIGNRPGGSCIVSSLDLDGNRVALHSVAPTCSERETGGWWGGRDSDPDDSSGGTEQVCTCPAWTNYDYKKIPSFIEHKSPTHEEFGAQVIALTSPDLPVDTDRYIDFISAIWEYAKIDYPHLFRVTPEENQDLTLENIDASLEKHLDEISTNINNIISSSNPNSLSSSERVIYDFLKVGTYPSATVDLHNDLVSRPLQTFTIEGDSKDISYYDTLVFSIYWANLKTVSGKYKFVFENYLSDQFGGNDFLFHLPKNKKSYEAAYIGAPGDSQNMYIKLDPEEKGTNPYASIIARNIALNTSLLSSNVFSPSWEDGTFKCAPPDGVPIWEWIPAVVCWLQWLLPPTIGISEGACWPSLLSEEEQEEILACQGDVNKNGISDCIEWKLTGGQLDLQSDADKYYYNSVWTLGAVIRDKNGAVVTLDSTSYIDFQLEKLEIPDDNLSEFTEGNSVTIYDANSSNLGGKQQHEAAQKYLSFRDARSRAVHGKSLAYFSTKRKDLNATFVASITTKDHSEETRIYLESNSLDIQVRWDRLFLNSYLVDWEDATDVSAAASSLKVSDAENVFLIDTNQKYVEDVAQEIYARNDTPEKVILALTNYSKNGNILSVEYPITIQVKKDGEVLYEESDIKRNQLEGFKPLAAIKTSGSLDFVIRDASGYVANKTLEFLPEVASRIDVELWTTVSQTGGNLTTHIVTLKDKFDNIASWELYNLDMDISGGGLEFYDTKDESFSTKTVEWYKIFRLETTSRQASNSINFTLKNSSGQTLASTSKNIRTIDTIDIDIQSSSGSIIVGGWIYDFEIELQDNSGNLLSDLNSRAYMVLNPLYGSTPNSYVDIVGGKATMQLQTKNIAGRNIKLEFQVEGMNSIVKEYIDILPDTPIQLDLSLSRDKIEASRTETTYLYPVLKDRYGNEVFTDNETEFSLEIAPEYASIITTTDATKTAESGRARFEIQWTDIPGIWYFKVSTSPSLDDNFFTLDGQAPFEKSRLTIPTMRNGGILSDTGKLFYKEYNSATYISKFTTQYLLENSEAYKELPSVLQSQVVNLWRETNSLDIYGVGENAGSIETFYFWNEENISGNKYNGIYSVLLGAPYGDISQENYLAWALLFDENNRSLAVTSLINNPYKYSDILSLGQGGNIQNISQSTDITQDIELRADFDSENRMYIDIFNAALGNYVGRSYYSLGGAEIQECSETASSCISDSETSIAVSVQDPRFSLYERGDGLVLKNSFGSDVLVFEEDGTIERKSSIYLDIDATNTSSYLQLNIREWENVIGQVAISLVDGDINITRDEVLLRNKLSTLENTLVVYLKTNQYGTRDIFEKNGDTQKIIFYNDPFGSKNTLDVFHSTQPEGIENFHEVKWLGWEENNKSLLAFSAGESVWESTQKYFSYSLINLWDPVVSLKKIGRSFINAPILEKSFDPTLGKRISWDDTVVWYQVFDYNNDEKDDVILIKTDGYIELLENKDIHSDYLSKGNLVHAVDWGPVRLVKTWDFTWDGFGDIFFVSDDGEPVIFNNHIKDFVRISLEEQMSLSGAVIQAEVFDMDNDGISDITTLDDAGQIHIFYGWGEPNNPEFTKLKVGDGYGIKISDTTLSRWGAVYFDELPQPSDAINADELITSNEEFQAELNASINGSWDWPTWEFFNELLADRLLFVKLPYSPYSYNASASGQQNLTDFVNSSIETTNYPELDESLRDSEQALTNFINQNPWYIDYNTSYGQSTLSSFLRSEYADTQWLTIEKTFIDVSPEFLQTGDLVNVELRLRNTGTQTLNNIAFVDTIAPNFTLHSQEVLIVSEAGKTIQAKPWLGLYDILIDGFFMSPWEEVVMRYTLKTLPLKYGYIQVGLFEEGELGDDEWGDIILKEDNLNCWQEADIYTSLSERTYIKWKTTPICEEDKLQLPDELAQNAIDENNNGVPDYIDALVWWEQEQIADYAQGVLDDLNRDSDGDGLPDTVDPIPNSDQDSRDIWWEIDAINETVDEISDQLDTVIEWFSCGFGGGSCIATPLNWAPLAPGWDPTLFGFPIGDGLKVNEGIPIFSALTGINIPTPSGCFQAPTVFPASPFQFTGSCNFTLGAGGSLGVNSPTNYVRLFATPTLTGGAGIAACFGGPAIVRGNIPPPGVHPIAPWGNCVVAAVPLFWCQWEEGDPSVTWYPWQYPWYGIINANCPSGVKDEKVVPEEIDNDFVRDYIEYKETGIKSQALVDSFKEAFSQVAEGGGNWSIPPGPLVNIGGWSATDLSLSVDFDASALSSGNFEDVIKVQNTRTAAFPAFLMDWVTRQIEEVVNKLTNLPKVFVILPDFSWIFDYGWEDFNENLQESFNDGKKFRQSERTQSEGKITSLRQQKSGLNCSWDDQWRCSFIDSQIRQLEQKQSFSTPETLSGIKAAYEFLGNVPLVDVEAETINVNIPWIDRASIDRATLDWRYTIDQWKSELERASAQWSSGKTCNFDNPSQQSACEENNEISKKLNTDANALISSLERNLEIIEEYKKLPEKLNKLISIKEVRLEQILCNIEAISSLLGEWISTNGERFKAWVELFILIKSILKSWQLLIDVFKWYDEECHQCKNERQDLQTFIWQLIGGVIPKLPIIQFPKWPDIVLDLHNVRAGITVYIPDFDINLRPIVLPTLPELHLPDVPSVNLDLPELPLLPEFSIPELPELPALPTVELPDLPPPPKIPKLFGAVEGILNILKLVTKVMCIIKQSPFVPEWRAGDQIAYITERSGYLSFDFIDITLPQFSYPFVDAITVTTYVNFEFETEFILEAVRQITAPLDTFTNDISNLFDITIPDIDYSWGGPTDIHVDLELDGDVEVDGLPADDLSSLKWTQKGFEFIALLFASKVKDLVVYMDDQKDVTLTNTEFITFVNENLASKSISENPRMNDIRKLWEDVNSLTYSKENKLIEALQENRKQKFEALSEIITTEIQESKELKKQVENIGENDFITKVAFENTSNIEAYNKKLEWYNEKLIQSAINLVHGDAEYNSYQDELRSTWESLVTEVRGGLESYASGIEKPNLLANHTAGHTSEASSGWSCSYGWSDYEYTYEWLYVLEFDRHYRLFEYLDELRGDEYVTPTDVDGDGDDDLLYMMNNQVFLKENLKNTDAKEYASLPPLILNVGDNVFYNGDIYYEAINNFEEANISDGFINVRFKAPTDILLDTFRLEFYTIVDKFRNLGDEEYRPRQVKKFVVDAIADIEENTITRETPEYTLGKHVAYLSQANVIPWLKLTNTKLINVREDLEANNIVTLTSWAKLSAGRNSFTIEYYTTDSDNTDTLTIPAHSYVSFPWLTYVVGLSGSAYAESPIPEDIEGAGIVGHIGKPLFPWARLTYTGNDTNLTESSYVSITHADGSEVSLHMSEVNNYRLYDLWSDEEEHLIRLKVENDFYYAKIHAFRDEVLGTYSQQILLSPQTQADTEPPQIGVDQKIRVPVYQKKVFDFTPYIYEDSGIENISDVRIDFDLWVDSDGDGDLRNDADIENITILQTPTTIQAEFGKYEELFEKQIRVSLTDENGNIGYQDVGFEVYSPAPQIQDYQNDTISWVIDETLTDEPVRIYRVRWWAIKKLENTEGSDVVDTFVGGSYSFSVPETSTGLKLQKDDVDVAIINEYTGNITLQNPVATTSILASNHPDNREWFPRIAINYAWEELFYEYIQPKHDPEIEIIQSEDDIFGEGIYVRILDQERYSSFHVPIGVAYNPGAIVLYLSGDDDKKDVFSIFRDGRIYSGDINRYILKYKSEGDRSTYLLHDTLVGVDIAQVFLEIEASYILR